VVKPRPQSRAEALVTPRPCQHPYVPA
jgi:hypothetical protein